MRSQIFLTVLGLGTVQTGLAATGKSFTGWDWYENRFLFSHCSNSHLLIHIS